MMSNSAKNEPILILLYSESWKMWHHPVDKYAVASHMQ